MACHYEFSEIESTVKDQEQFCAKKVDNLNDIEP